MPPTHQESPGGELFDRVRFLSPGFAESRSKFVGFPFLRFLSLCVGSVGWHSGHAVIWKGPTLRTRPLLQPPARSFCLQDKNSLSHPAALESPWEESPCRRKKNTSIFLLPNRDVLPAAASKAGWRHTVRRANTLRKIVSPPQPTLLTRPAHSHLNHPPHIPGGPGSVG